MPSAFKVNRLRSIIRSLHVNVSAAWNNSGILLGVTLHVRFLCISESVEVTCELPFSHTLYSTLYTAPNLHCVEHRRCESNWKL